MTQSQRYQAAVARAEHKKAQFFSSASVAKERIAPARLKQDLKDKATDSLANGWAYLAAKSQQQPVAIGATATAVLLYLFRKPILALLNRTYVRITDGDPEQAENGDG